MIKETFYSAQRLLSDYKINVNKRILYRTLSLLKEINTVNVLIVFDSADKGVDITYYPSTGRFKISIYQLGEEPVIEYIDS